VGPRASLLKYTMELGNNSIHILEITLKKTQAHTDTAVFRTYHDSLTDCTMPESSCHPINHKMALNRYFYCRIDTYPLEKPEKETKPNTARNNLHNNQ
jgi:hypothetical protein